MVVAVVMSMMVMEVHDEAAAAAADDDVSSKQTDGQGSSSFCVDSQPTIILELSVASLASWYYQERVFPTPSSRRGHQDKVAEEEDAGAALLLLALRTHDCLSLSSTLQ